MRRTVEVKVIKTSKDIELGRPGHCFIYVNGSVVDGPMSEDLAQARAKQIEFETE